MLLLKVYYAASATRTLVIITVLTATIIKLCFWKARKMGKAGTRVKDSLRRGNKAIAIMTKVPSLQYGEMAH